MSLLAFQLALADLTASVETCARVAADAETALAEYDLTPVERRRLESAARQQGARVNTALYRYNRITTLVTVLPGTIHLLGTQARAVADAFWAGRGPDRNMRREAELFADFLLGMIEDGRLDVPHLRETVDFELARYQVAVAPRQMLLEQVDEDARRWPDGPLALHPLVRLVTFEHDPIPLQWHLAYKHAPPYADLAAGEFHLLLDARGDAVEQRPLDVDTGRLLRSAGNLDPRAAGLAMLIDAGLLVHAAPAEASALA